mmetsp:Transcript_103527/g.221387  ORF Transcript_103527/g.221387 Transcript_103527/m.221387 type:complete len:180 (-) Transcript_103527:8-547(-)
MDFDIGDVLASSAALVLGLLPSGLAGQLRAPFSAAADIERARFSVGGDVGEEVMDGETGAFGEVSDVCDIDVPIGVDEDAFSVLIAAGDSVADSSPTASEPSATAPDFGEVVSSSISKTWLLILLISRLVARPMTENSPWTSSTASMAAGCRARKAEALRALPAPQTGSGALPSHLPDA